jgi:predicted negative regulator of RcsB-dependent stress response
MSDPDSDRALYVQGLELLEAGDSDGAEAAWRQASRGSSSAAHAAALGRGAILHDRGDLAGAADEWHWAVSADEEEVGVPAAVNYGRLISYTEFGFAHLPMASRVGKSPLAKSLGGNDVADADRLWRRAAESNHPHAAWAWIGLGRLYDPSELAAEPDWDESENAYRRALASGHPDAGPCGAMKLGRLLNERVRFGAGADTRERALGALQVAVDSGQPEWAGIAAFDIGCIYADDGDKSNAERYWRIAEASGNAAIRPAVQSALHDRNSAFRAALRKKSGLRRFFAN